MLILTSGPAGVEGRGRGGDLIVPGVDPGPVGDGLDSDPGRINLPCRELGGGGFFFGGAVDVCWGCNDVGDWLMRPQLSLPSAPCPVPPNDGCGESCATDGAVSVPETFCTGVPGPGCVVSEARASTCPVSNNLLNASTSRVALFSCACALFNPSSLAAPLSRSCNVLWNGFGGCLAPSSFSWSESSS
mgnify:CR=1 FL=1